MTKSALPIRSPLETLRIEFPEYRISQRVIGNKLFYIAEATDSDVRPVFAQAATVDRLRAKLRVPEVEINAETVTGLETAIQADYRTSRSPAGTLGRPPGNYVASVS